MPRFRKGPAADVTSVASVAVCVEMMVLKIRLETEEWVYEEHE